MADNNYAPFVKAFLSRGAVGLAVGFSAVAPVAAKQVPNSADNVGLSSFADRLATIRSAVSVHIKSHNSLELKVAQNFSNFGNFANNPKPY
jgi:hypothetical protein